MVFTGLFAIAWNSFILFWTLGALSAPFPVNLPFALFSLPFWGAGAFMVYTLLLGLFGRIRLRLDSQKISFTQELFGFKWHRPRPSTKESIRKLVYTKKHWTKDSDGDGLRPAVGDRTQVPAQLDIWAGVQKYQLGTNSAIQSEAELEWLAHEISDWLGIPIHRE